MINFKGKIESDTKDKINTAPDFGSFTNLYVGANVFYVLED